MTAQSMSSDPWTRRYEWISIYVDEKDKTKWVSISVIFEKCQESDISMTNLSSAQFKDFHEINMLEFTLPYWRDRRDLRRKRIH